MQVAFVIPEGDSDAAGARRDGAGRHHRRRLGQQDRVGGVGLRGADHRGVQHASASPTRASASRGPGLDARVRVLFNPSLSAVNTMIPGLIATILLISMIVDHGQAVVRERERGTLEQMFVTPITRGEYLIGKIMPYVVVAIVQIAIVALVGRFWFRVPFNGRSRSWSSGCCCSCSRRSGMGLLVSLVSQHPAAGAADGHVHPDPDDGALRLHLPDRVDAGRSRPAHLPHPAALRARGAARRVR